MSIVNTDMTRRYEWTPASEPPDGYRAVLVWVVYDSGRGYPDFGSYSNGSKCNGGWNVSGVTHWRDVEPPNSSATLTGSGDQ